MQGMSRLGTMNFAMKIELYGLARRRAGTDRVELDATTLDAALLALARACPGLVPDVIAEGTLSPGFLASINGTRFTTRDHSPLHPDDVLIIMGAEAGG